MRKVVLSALCAAALLTACNNSGQNKSTLQAPERLTDGRAVKP